MSETTKERFTVNLPPELIERARNAVYWTPGLTLAGLAEDALFKALRRLEKGNGGPFKERNGQALPLDLDPQGLMQGCPAQRATLVEGAREAGAYTVRWDGRDDAGRELASGVYLYRLQAGAQVVETHKLLLLR